MTWTSICVYWSQNLSTCTALWIKIIQDHNDKDSLCMTCLWGRSSLLLSRLKSKISHITDISSFKYILSWQDQSNIFFLYEIRLWCLEKKTISFLILFKVQFTSISSFLQSSSSLFIQARIVAGKRIEQLRSICNTLKVTKTLLHYKSHKELTIPITRCWMYDTLNIAKGTTDQGVDYFN